MSDTAKRDYLWIVLFLIVFINGFENGFTFFVDTLFTDVLKSSRGKFALSLVSALAVIRMSRQEKSYS